MEIFRTEFLEEIAKSDQIKAEVEQSVITFSLQEEHRADILEQLRLCALENFNVGGVRIEYYVMQTFIMDPIKASC